MKIRLGFPSQELINVPAGFPPLTNTSPIRIDYGRRKGFLAAANCFVILTIRINNRPQERWHIESKGFCSGSSSILRARLLQDFPSADIWATGCLDEATLAFDFIAENVSTIRLREFVIRAFEPIQMDEFWRYERAAIKVQGSPLEPGGITIFELLARHGLYIKRRN